MKQSNSGAAIDIKHTQMAPHFTRLVDKAQQFWREDYTLDIKMEINSRLLDHLKLLNCDVESDHAAKQCEYLRKSYDLDEDEFAEKWVDYVVNIKDGGTNLDVTDAKVPDFAKWLKDNINLYEPREDRPKKSTYVDDEDILGIYGYVKQGNIVKEPSHGDGDMAQDERPADGDVAGASIKPLTSTGDHEEILLKFGNEITDWKNCHTRHVTISKTNDPHPIPGENFFYNKMEDYSIILEQNCRNIGQVLTEIWPTDAKHPVVTSNVKEKTLYDLRTWGRIACDEDAKLNAASIILVGEKTHWYHSLNDYESESEEDEPNPEFLDPGEDSLAVEEEISVEDAIATELEPPDNDLKQRKECIPLDVSRLQKYSLFPGQIIGVEGRNPTRNVLCAYKITNGVPFPKPPPPKLNSSLQIVVGSGPFTKNDSSDFTLLYNIMSYVAKNEPNILILVGPFIPDSFAWVNDAKNERSYQELFENLIEKIMSYVEGKCTQVVMIASYEDAHHDPFYPTPEYSIRNSLKRPNLHLMPDPCMLDIEGLIIGVTSVDVIRHMSSEEISHNMQRTNRLGRLAEHLLLQASFYPLYPPSPEVPLDIEIWADCGVMHRVPHILLLPSAMRYYHHWTNGTFIMNPSKACKGAFTRLNISIDDNNTGKPNICGEVVKLQQ